MKFTIRQISKLKGSGAVATKDIEYGEIVLQEQAWFTVKVVPSASYESRANELEESFNSLPQHAKDSVLALSDCRAGSNQKEPSLGSTLAGLLRTNGMRLDDGPSPCTAILPIYSRFNHSCVPSLTIVPRPGNAIELFARRPIKELEELTVSYLAPYTNLSREARTTHFQNQYCFKCDCKHCVEDWDVERSQLEVLRLSISNHMEKEEFKVAIEQLRALEQLAIRLDLDGPALWAWLAPRALTCCQTVAVESAEVYTWAQHAYQSSCITYPDEDNSFFEIVASSLRQEQFQLDGLD